jgi:hypothetical protein
LQGFPPETFTVEFAQLQRKRKRLTTAIEAQAATSPTMLDLENTAGRIFATLGDMRQVLKSANPLRVKRTLSWIVKKIEIDRRGLRGYLFLRPLPAMAESILQSGDVSLLYNSGLRQERRVRSLPTDKTNRP